MRTINSSYRSNTCLVNYVDEVEMGHWMRGKQKSWLYDKSSCVYHNHEATLGKIGLVNLNNFIVINALHEVNISFKRQTSWFRRYSHDSNTLLLWKLLVDKIEIIALIAMLATEPEYIYNLYCCSYYCITGLIERLHFESRWNYYFMVSVSSITIEMACSLLLLSLYGPKLRVSEMKMAGL